MKIVLEKIIKDRNIVSYSYSCEGLEKYINENIKLFYEYEQDISNVPDSILIIPFLSNLLPLVFVLNVDVYINDVDQSFFLAIDEYRKAYSCMIPMLSFGGRVISKKITQNIYPVKGSCLLFSGGIDATNSLVMNEKNINDCITIWGSDIKVSNNEGWLKMSKTINDTVKKFNKRWVVIKSNFREIINEKELTEYIIATKDNWWHAMQHGIALLGQVSPLAYINKYKQIFIASSFTQEWRPICASDPKTDSCFKCGNTITIHDGFEFDRSEKVKNIYERIDDLNINLELHVCWESSSGSNCGHCEKCLRSFLNCKSVGVDPNKLGIRSIYSMKKIKRIYFTKVIYDQYSLERFRVLKKNIKKTFGQLVPKELNWIIKTDFSSINNSLYWKIKKMVKKILGK